MARFGMVIGLKADQLDEYQKLYEAVWPDVLKTAINCHIGNYTIFLRKMPDGEYYLFNYFEYHGIDYAADMRRMASDPVTQEWWKLCMPCLEPLPDRTEGEWWAMMQEIYHYE